MAKKVYSNTPLSSYQVRCVLAAGRSDFIFRSCSQIHPSLRPYPALFPISIPYKVIASRYSLFRVDPIILSMSPIDVHFLLLSPVNTSPGRYLIQIWRCRSTSYCNWFIFIYDFFEVATKHGGITIPSNKFTYSESTKR